MDIIDGFDRAQERSLVTCLQFFCMGGLARSARRQLSMLLCLVVASTSAIAGVNTFTFVGPEGGSVYRMVYHPTNSSIVYITTPAGFYRSIDGGSSWQLIRDDFSATPEAIAVHVSQPSRVLVTAAGNGVLSSNDSGVTLNSLGSYPEPLASSLPEVVYSYDGSLLYVLQGNRIYRSADGGGTWQQGGLATNSNDVLMAKLIVDPTNPRRLYMSGFSGNDAFQSSDGGDTWQPWGVPGTVIGLSAANTQPVRIWVAGSAGTLYTDDGGSHWTQVFPGLSTMIAIDPSAPSVVYSGDLTGLIRTTDNGLHWTHVQGATRAGALAAMAFDPANSQRMLLAGTEGIVGSTNGGATWTLRNQGLHALAIHELATSPISHRTYMHVLYGSVFAMSGADHSTESLGYEKLQALTGRPWLSGLGLVVQPGNPDRVLLSVDEDIARSDDAGANWTRSALPALNTGLIRLLTPSSDQETLLAITETDLYRSNNGGSDWATLPSPAGVYLGAAAAVAPSNPTIVYIAEKFNASSAVKIIKSIDAGLTWNATAALPSQFIRAIAVDPRTDQTVYAAGEHGVFKSVDAGASWTILSPQQRFEGPQAIVIDPQTPDIVYVGGVNQLLRTVDGGERWQALPVPAKPLWIIGALALDPERPHSLFAAVSGRGMREISIEPDLVLTQTATNSTIFRGQERTYHFVVQNRGPFDATVVRTTVHFPAGATGISASVAGGACAFADTTISCAVPILRANASLEMLVKSTQQTAGNYQITAKVEAEQPDVISADNTVTSALAIAEPQVLAPAPTPTTPAATSKGGGGSDSLLMIAILFGVGVQRSFLLQAQRFAFFGKPGR